MSQRELKQLSLWSEPCKPVVRRANKPLSCQRKSTVKKHRRKWFDRLRKYTPIVSQWIAGPVLIVILYKYAGLPPDLIAHIVAH